MKQEVKRKSFSYFDMVEIGLADHHSHQVVTSCLLIILVTVENLSTSVTFLIKMQFCVYYHSSSASHHD